MRWKKNVHHNYVPDQRLTGWMDGYASRENALLSRSIPATSTWASSPVFATKLVLLGETEENSSKQSQGPKPKNDEITLSRAREAQKTKTSSSGIRGSMLFVCPLFAPFASQSSRAIRKSQPDHKNCYQSSVQWDKAR